MSLTLDGPSGSDYTDFILHSLKSNVDHSIFDDQISEVALDIFLSLQPMSSFSAKEFHIEILDFSDKEAQNDIIPWYNWSDALHAGTEEIRLCKHGFFNTCVKATREAGRFIKQHKTACAVTAVFIGAGIILLCTAGTAAPAAAAGVAALGGALASNEPTEPPTYRPPNNIPSPTPPLNPNPVSINNEPAPTPLSATPFSLIKAPEQQPPSAFLNPVQAAMILPKATTAPPFLKGDNLPVQKPMSLAPETLADTKAIYPTPIVTPEPSVRFFDHAKEVATRTKDTTVSIISDTTHRLWDSSMEIASVTELALKGCDKGLDTLGLQSPNDPNTIGVKDVVFPMNRILNSDLDLAQVKKDGHLAIDEFFCTDQAKKFDPDAEKSFSEKNTAMGELPFISPTVGSSTSATKTISTATKAIQTTSTATKELELAAREINQLKKIETTAKELQALNNIETKVASATEKTLAQSNKVLLTEEALLASKEKFDLVDKFLEPYLGKFMPETLVRDLLHQAGIKTFPRPKGVPENFRVRLSDKGAGMLYMHPENTHTSIRVMPGKPHSINPYQQKPYILYRKHGHTVDKFGNMVDKKSMEAHIPLDEFIHLGN